jgi:hypothetical protein
MGEGFKKINKEEITKRSELIAVVILWWLDKGFSGTPLDVIFQNTKSTEDALKLYVDTYKNVSTEGHKRMKVFVKKFRTYLGLKNASEKIITFQTTTKADPEIEKLAAEAEITYMKYPAHTKMVVDFKEIKATYQRTDDPEPILIFRR